MKIPSSLSKIYKEFDSCKRCRKENNSLLHILGGGKLQNPQFLFLFINPTHLNISSHQDYLGRRRYPFIGVRHFYRLLSEAGFLNKKLVADIYRRGWRVNDEDRIEQDLIERGVYMTNLVKCARYNPDNPSKNIIKEDFPLFQKEIRAVSPKYIVSFGALPFKTITGKTIRLGDTWIDIQNNNYHPFQSLDILGNRYPTLPCYFPVGRGNPSRSLDILSYIKKHYYN